jgi:hypothetical protein
MAAQTDFLSDVLSGYTRDNLASLIDKLAGDKDNLHVDLRHVKFSLRGQSFSVDGVVDFKVVHSVPNAHAVVRGIVEKYG